MNVAEWILVVILSVTLFIFLVVGIVLLVKLLGIAEEAKKVIKKSQDIADNANGIVTNVKDLTSVGGVVKSFVDKYVEPKVKKEGSKNGGRKSLNRQVIQFRLNIDAVHGNFSFIHRHLQQLLITIHLFQLLNHIAKHAI